MAITSITVKLYQDSKRNTATAYLKFNDINDQIYLGFSEVFQEQGLIIKSNQAKSKNTKNIVTGITATLTYIDNGYWKINLEVLGEKHRIALEPTDTYPLTAQGHWQRVVLFDTWFEENSAKNVSISDILGL